MKLTMVDESSIPKKNKKRDASFNTPAPNDIIDLDRQYEIKKLNQDRLRMLFAPSDNPNPHLSQAILFGKAKNGNEYNAIQHLNSLSPEARTQLLGDMYKLYTHTMQKNLEALEAMSG